MGLLDVVFGRRSRLGPTSTSSPAVRGDHRAGRTRFHPDGPSGRSLPSPRGTRLRGDRSRCACLARCRRRPAGRHRRRPPATTGWFRHGSGRCRDRCHRRACGECLPGRAGWPPVVVLPGVFPWAGRPATRPRVLIRRARSILSRPPRAATSSATTCWSFRSETCSRVSCRWRKTSDAGLLCGTHPACKRACKGLSAAGREPLVARGSGTGKGKHSIERNLRPMLGIRIDIDLVDDVASRQTLQRPHQVG